MDMLPAIVSDLAVKSSLVLLLAFGLSFALKGSRPAIRHRLWAATILFSLLLPLLCLNHRTTAIRVLPEFGMSKSIEADSARTLPHFAQQDGVSFLGHPATPSQASRDIAGRGGAPLAPGRNLSVRSEVNLPSDFTAQSLFERGAILWAGITTLLMLATMARLLAARRLLASCVPVHGRGNRDDDPLPGLDEVVRSSWNQLTTRGDGSISTPRWLRDRLSVRVGGSPDFPKVPMTCGMLNPVILLPRECAGWPRKQLESVLLHEMAHVKRGDWILTIAAHLAAALYWFNPMIWIASSRLRYEAEECADELVLASGVAPTSYARHLLAVARSLSSGGLPAAAVAMAEQSDVSRRLTSILRFQHGKTLWKIGDRIAAAAVCAVLICLTAVRLAPHSRLVDRERSAALHFERWFSTGGESCLTFTPDGARLLVGSARHRTAPGSPSGRRGFWSAESGELVSEKTVPVPMTATAYSYDGRTLATGYGDGTLRLSDSDTGRTFREMRLSNSAIDIVQFSPDDLTICVAAHKRTVLIETATGRPRTPEYAGIFRHIADASPAEPYAVVSEKWGIIQWDRNVTIWSARDGGTLKLPVRAAACAAKGHILAVLSGRRLQLWNIDRRAMIVSTDIGGSAGAGARIAFSPNGDRIALACHGIVEMWRVREDLLKS